MGGGAAVVRRVRVVNRRGLHARPAARIAKIAERFDAEILLATQHGAVSALSIMGLLTLSAAAGTEVEVRATGREAEAAAEAIAAYIAEGFGEDR